MYNCQKQDRIHPPYHSVSMYTTLFARFGPTFDSTVLGRQHVEELISILKRGANPPKGFWCSDDASMENTYNLLVQELEMNKISEKKELDNEVTNLEKMLKAHDEGKPFDSKSITSYWDRIRDFSLEIEGRRERMYEFTRTRTK